jgi:hypothetical protein
MDDRISKAFCYAIPLTFFFKVPAAIPLRLLAQKMVRQLSGNTAEKLPPTRQYFRLDIYRSPRNNFSQFHATTQKGSSNAQPTVG